MAGQIKFVEAGENANDNGPSVRLKVEVDDRFADRENMREMIGDCRQKTVNCIYGRRIEVKREIKGSLKMSTAMTTTTTTSFSHLNSQPLPQVRVNRLC